MLGALITSSFLALDRFSSGEFFQSVDDDDDCLSHLHVNNSLGGAKSENNAGAERVTFTAPPH